MSVTRSPFYQLGVIRYPLPVAVARDLLAVVVIRFRYPSLVVASRYRDPLIVVFCCPSLSESVFCCYVLSVAIHYPLSVIRYRYSLFVICVSSSYPFAGIDYLPMTCCPLIGLRSRVVNPLPVSHPLSVTLYPLGLAVSRRQSSTVVVH